MHTWIIQCLRSAGKISPNTPFYSFKDTVLHGTRPNSELSSMCFPSKNSGTHVIDTNLGPTLLRKMGTLPVDAFLSTAPTLPRLLGTNHILPFLVSPFENKSDPSFFGLPLIHHNWYADMVAQTASSLYALESLCMLHSAQFHCSEPSNRNTEESSLKTLLRTSLESYILYELLFIVERLMRESFGISYSAMQQHGISSIFEQLHGLLLKAKSQSAAVASELMKLSESSQSDEFLSDLDANLSKKGSHFQMPLKSLHSTFLHPLHSKDLLFFNLEIDKFNEFRRTHIWPVLQSKDAPMGKEREEYFFTLGLILWKLCATLVTLSRSTLALDLERDTAYHEQRLAQFGAASAFSSVHSLMSKMRSMTKHTLPSNQLENTLSGGTTLTVHPMYICM